MHSNASVAASRTCPVCLGQFRPKRPWARFCSVRCRNLFHRQNGSFTDLRRRIDELERRVRALEGK